MVAIIFAQFAMLSNALLLAFAIPDELPEYETLKCSDDDENRIPHAEFELLDESANAVTSEMYRGRLRLVFFGFTSCPGVCPITLQHIAAALNSLGPLAQRVTVLFISVDPKRDSPDMLRQYKAAFHPLIIGLTGTYDQLSNVTSGFRTTFGFNVLVDGEERPLSREEYEVMSPETNYFPYRSSQVYLIGANDQLLDIIGYGSKARLIAEKIRAYITEAGL